MKRARKERKPRTCDAARALGHTKECSRDRVDVWHGFSEPARMCGFHASHLAGLCAGFYGHAMREQGRTAGH